MLVMGSVMEPQRGNGFEKKIPPPGFSESDFPLPI
jgi:hypothetical protein